MMKSLAFKIIVLILFLLSVVWEVVQLNKNINADEVFSLRQSLKSEKYVRDYILEQGGKLEIREKSVLSQAATGVDLYNTTWESSNPSVLKVNDDRTLEAVGVGVAQLVITSKKNKISVDVVVEPLGWVLSNNKYYFYLETGRYVVGWLHLDNKYYYFSANGEMQKNWVVIDGHWYYFSTSGEMLSGWQEINGKWYYFQNDGKMLTGWLSLKNKKYYLGEDGAMVTGKQVIDGKKYVFDDNGVLTK